MTDTKKQEERVATPERPVWAVDEASSIITRSTGETNPLEKIAKYDRKSGIVEILPGMSGMRLTTINFMKASDHHYSSIGKIGLVEIVPSEAPPKPPKSRRLGEKQTERVKWMAKYMPETFLVMWGVEQMQVRTGFRKESRIGVREDSGDRYNYVEDVPEYENVQGFDFSVPALISGEQRLIASAKTCLTHAAAEADVSGDYDDSLDQVGGSDD